MTSKQSLMTGGSCRTVIADLVIEKSAYVFGDEMTPNGQWNTVLPFFGLGSPFQKRFNPTLPLINFLFSLLKPKHQKPKNEVPCFHFLVSPCFSCYCY